MKKIITILMMILLSSIAFGMTPEQCQTIDIQNVDAKETYNKTYVNNGTTLNLLMLYRTLEWNLSDGSCEVVWKQPVIWSNQVSWISKTWKYPKVISIFNEQLNTSYQYMREILPIWNTASVAEKYFVSSKYNVFFQNKINQTYNAYGPRIISYEREYNQRIQDSYNDIPMSG